MFSAFTAGACLVVTGAIGWNVGRTHGMFEGGRWADGPIWWQIALGVGLLLLGVYWSRRLGEPDGTSTGAPRDRMLKYVGRGKSAGAKRSDQTRESSARERSTGRRPGSPH